MLFCMVCPNCSQRRLHLAHENGTATADCTYRALLAGFGLGLGSYFVYGAGIVRRVVVVVDVSLQGGPARDTHTPPQEDERMVNRSMSVLVPMIRVSVDANGLPDESTTDASSNSAFFLFKYVR